MSAPFRRFHFLTVLLLAVPATLAAQTAAGVATAERATVADSALAPLPIDSAVTIGTLPNGIRYYIRENHEPERRAEFRLVVKAGSLQEDDDQRGIAHFLEHMAFNGTRNFEKQALIDYLESIGMRFGGDLNASTTYDHTLYKLTIPTDAPGAIETGFQILDDWARGITLDPAEIEAERGVVLSEWRTRLGVGSRIRARTDSVLLGGSRYLERQPIGVPERIETADRETLLRFYRDWYRPDLMAVVVVGAVEKDRIEQLIHDTFGSIPAPSKARERGEYTIPDREEPRALVITDPELTGTRVELIRLYRPKPINSVERIREGMVNSIFASILNKRLRDIANSGNASFLEAGTSFSGYLGGLNAHTVIAASTRDDALVDGLRAALIEVERIARHGIKEEELEREKRSAQSGYRQALITRSKINSVSYANSYISHFLTGRTPASVESTVALSRALLEGITAEEVAAVANAWKSRENLALIAMLPEKEGVTPPTAEELMAVLDDVERAEVPAEGTTLVAAGAAGELLPNPPAPGNVAGVREIPEVGITEWTLSNGVRVLLKPTDFTPDQILFHGYSWGGTSLLDDDELRDVALARALPGIAGLGSLNSAGIREATVGKLLRVGVNIGSYMQSISGQSTGRDFETFLQLVYLHFTAPRLDEEAIRSWKHRSKTVVEGRIASPEAHFADTLRTILVDRHPRSRVLSPAAIDSIDPQRALEIYRDRFGDAGAFTFILVGDFAPDSVRPLIEQYLGGLPDLPGKRGWRDNGIRAPEGVVEKVFHFGREPRARTAIVFNGPYEHAEDQQSALGAMANILNVRLRERLREALGGTYSVSVRPEVSSIPERTYSIQVIFESDPERVDEMREAVFEEIERLREEGPTEEEMAKVREEFARQIELSVKQNSFWLQIIALHDRMERPLAGLAEYAEIFTKLDREQVHEMSRKYLDLQRYVRVTQLPAN